MAFLDQMKVVAMGGARDPDRRVTELHESLIAAVERRLGRGDTAAKVKELMALFGAAGADEVTPDAFLKVADALQLMGTVDDKLALFDRFDINENGTLSREELSAGVFGTKRAPLRATPTRNVLAKMKEKVLRRGGENGPRALTRTLRIMDSSGNFELSPQELARGLERYGLPVTDEELTVIVKAFDRDGSGHISIQEFLRGLRGRFPPQRAALVKLAFGVLDKAGDGRVTMKDLSAVYDASRHPAVLKKERTAAQVMQEFSASWDKNKDGTITYEEFEDYYKDLSAAIQDDQYFELMIRNAWHISGGTGAAANTSCRRVLVVHTNGNQTVREVENDIGLKANDLDKIRAALVRQGIDDIARIELYA